MASFIFAEFCVISWEYQALRLQSNATRPFEPTCVSQERLPGFERKCNRCWSVHMVDTISCLTCSAAVFHYIAFLVGFLKISRGLWPSPRCCNLELDFSILI